MLKRFLIFSLGFAGLVMVQACGRYMAPEPACHFVQNSNMQRVSWKDHLPVKMYVHSSIPPKYYFAIENAVRTWNQKRELIKIEGWGSTGVSEPSRDGYSVLYMLDRWDEDRPQEQARTTIYWTGNQIYEADIRFNDQNFDFHAGAEKQFSDVDFESLVLHELGHALGLSHIDGDVSVMNSRLPHGLPRRAPSEKDEGALSCEY